MSMKYLFESTVIAAFVASAGAAAADPAPTRDYVVRPGDSCMGIAIRELGDRAALAKIHELNPDLGPTPHNLKPGQIWKLPVAAAEPDAKLTGSRGVVRVRQPAIDNWDPAQRGMDLYRAWRINSQESSSAEVTFQDASRLAMRENTIVVIFGPLSAHALVTPTQAVLESGGLESRLDAASKKTLVVRTPSSEAQVGAGHSLVTVDASGASIVGNHGGAAVVVRGVDAQKHATGAGVAVNVGMGSKVVQGKPPAKPRKLPPAPSWTAGPHHFLDLAGGGATLAVHWDAVPTAAKYRVELVDRAGAELASLEVPATVTALEAPRVPVGTYIAHVSTIDTEGFESIRSVDAPLDVLAAAAYAPGSVTPLVAAVPALAGPELRGTAAAPAPFALAQGGRIEPPAGVACAQGGLGGGRLDEHVVVTVGGAPAVTCVAADGTAFAPVALAVAPVMVTDVTAGGQAPPIPRTGVATIHVTLASSAPLGPDLVVRSDDVTILSTTKTATGFDVVVTSPSGESGRLLVMAGPQQLGAIRFTVAALAAPPVVAPPAPAKPRVPVELGASAGYEFYRDSVLRGAALGGGDSAHILAPGPTVGLRAGRAIVDLLGLDLEGGLVVPAFRAAPGHALVLTWRAHADLRFYSGPTFGLHLLIGGGTDSLVSTSTATTRETAWIFDRALRLTAAAGPHATWFLELGDEVQPSRDNSHIDVIDARIGFSKSL